MSGLLLLLFFMRLTGGDAERLCREGKYAQAGVVYRALIVRNPNSAEDWAGFGRSLLELGNREATVPLVRALQLKPADPDIELTLARAELRNGNVSAAVALLEPLTHRTPDRPEPFFLLGQTMYNGGFYQRALQLLGQSLALDPTNRQAGIMYAISLAKAGRSAEAEAACLKILSETQSGWDLDLALTYVELLDDAGRTPEASHYVDRVIQDRPQDPMAHFWKARVLLHSEHLAEAAREAERSVSLAPSLPFARNLLVQIYRRQGRLEEAQRQAAWLREHDEKMAGPGH